MKHASLFTGIDGFDLAAEWMGWENIFQCEIDEYCNKLLAQNFPNTIKYGDIKATDFSIYRGRVDILSGGFPCQPYSTAGKRLGKEDERHLWPYMLRSIQQIQPTWIVGENVRGLTNWNGGWYSTRCKLTWKLRATKSHRFYFLLQVSTLPTEEKEYFFLPTPQVFDAKGSFIKGKEYNGESKHAEKLGQAVMRLLPTPQTQGLKECDRNGKTRFMDLSLLPTPTNSMVTAQDFIQANYHSSKRPAYSSLLPTPTASSDPKGVHSTRSIEAVGHPSTPHARPTGTGKTSQLNPEFVEEMQGFPIGWTALRD